jgi:probable O-glycosylation ligase (exosortase A-associated)
MAFTTIAFWCLYLLGTGAAMLVPLAGVLLYILIYHLNPEFQWWGESIRVLGLRTSMTTVLATVIGLMLRFPRFEAGGRQLPAPIFFGLLLVIYACLSMSWGFGASDRGFYMAEKIIKVMIFVLILIRCVQEPRHYHMVVIVWLLGIFYIGYQAFGNVGVRSNGRLSLGIGGPDFAESSGLAVHLVSVLPVVGAMFFMCRRWWTRGLVLLTGALAVNTIIMTRTRNALFGLAVMILAGLFSMPRGYRLKGWVAIGVGTILALQLADPGWWERIATIPDYQKDLSATNRLLFWTASLEMARDFPMGIGLGNFHEVVKQYVPNLNITRAAHSTYFACLAELGYPGFALFMLVGITALWRLTRIHRAAARFESDLPIQVGRWRMRFHLGWHAMAMRIGLCGYLASSVFTTRLWTEDFWIMIGLICCLSNITERLRATAAVSYEARVDLRLRPMILEAT